VRGIRLLRTRERTAAPTDLMLPQRPNLYVVALFAVLALYEKFLRPEACFERERFWNAK